MSLYDNMQATATKLLTKLGQSMTLKRSSSTSHNPVTGVVTETPVSVTVKGVLLSPGSGSSVSSFGEKKWPGVDVQSSDRRILCVSDTAPVVDDRFAVSGKDYRVLAVDEVNPAGTAVIYNCLVRA